MRPGTAASVCLLLLLAAAAAAAAHASASAGAESLVSELDAGALVTALATQSVVVKFHTRWCGRYIYVACRHTRRRSRRRLRHCTQVRLVQLLRAGVRARGGRVFGQEHSQWGGSGVWQVCAPPHPTPCASLCARDTDTRTCVCVLTPTLADQPARASVDVDAHKDVAASFGVRSVPFVTLLRRDAWFTHDPATGEPVPVPPERYDGPLAAGPTAEWVSNRCAQRVGQVRPGSAPIALTHPALERDCLFRGARRWKSSHPRGSRQQSSRTTTTTCWSSSTAPGATLRRARVRCASPLTGGCLYSCGRCLEFEPHYKQVR